MKRLKRRGTASHSSTVWRRCALPRTGHSASRSAPAIETAQVVALIGIDTCRRFHLLIGDRLPIANTIEGPIFKYYLRRHRRTAFIAGTKIV